MIVEVEDNDNLALIKDLFGPTQGDKFFTPYYFDDVADPLEEALFPNLVIDSVRYQIPYYRIY